MQKPLYKEVIVIGAGPGGYTAAFRAADLGFNTALIDKSSELGGVCLNVGCIPSKALLHIAKVMEETLDLRKMGVTYNNPNLDLKQIRSWKNTVVSGLNKGIASLAEARKVEVIKGVARFTSNTQLEIDNGIDKKLFDFKHCIIATGSSPATLKDFPDDPRILNSTGALNLENIPDKLLIIGGGYIGLEMGSIYHSLGSKITVVEYLDTLLPGADKDLVKPLENRLKRMFTQIKLNTKVKSVIVEKNSLKVNLESDKDNSQLEFDQILVSVGRTPNTQNLGLDNTNIKTSEKGFIDVNNKMQTNASNIYAIGDVVGNPMLAHKATYEGKVAAEVIADLPASNDSKCIPSVIFTDPEIAWAGLTETEAKKKDIPYSIGEFPWRASGKAISQGRIEGKTKTIFDPISKQILGIGIVGTNAGDLIAEGVLAIEMCADVEDIGLTIHPHPTLSESIGLSAESFNGTITDLYIPKK